MAKCVCPKPTALTTVPAEDCPVDLGQLQRAIIQRGGFAFDPTADVPTDITKKADWLVLKSAVGDTEAVVTPFFRGDAVITPGEAIFNGGGDNSTLNGEEEFNGVNPSKFSALFKSLPTATKKALTGLSCEVGLVVYFINENNQIIASENGDTAEGFPISSFFVADRGNEGFASKDKFAVGFNLKARWDDTLKIYEPEAGFRPLVDL